MNYHQPTEVLGNAINAWDEFYRTYFDMVYQQTLELCHNTLKAKELTDKIFVKVFLNNPQDIVNNDDNTLKNQLCLLFPYLGIAADPKKELSAGRLLHLYYQPN